MKLSLKGKLFEFKKRKEVNEMRKNEMELYSEKMGVIFSSVEDIPDEEPEEVIEYDIICSE